VSARPRRGDVYWVALDPVLGSEIRKTRPAVIVSNDAMNRYGHRVVVVPLTSNVEGCYPGEALVQVKGKPARALGDQLRSIDKMRLGRRLDTLTRDEVAAIEGALRITLELT
jgi:mRNA interferase MazF